MQQSAVNNIAYKIYPFSLKNFTDSQVCHFNLLP